MNLVLAHLTLIATLSSSGILLPAQSYAVHTLAEESTMTREDLESVYKINHCFNIGNRDGYSDHKKNESREHHQKCLGSDESQAYLSGYQEGFVGKRSYRRDHRLSSWARVRTVH
jgi:hypothetical protein